MLVNKDIRKININECHFIIFLTNKIGICKKSGLERQLRFNPI